MQGNREEDRKREIDRMAKLEGFHNRLLGELGECQMQIIKGSIKGLLTYFKSDDIAQKFYTWYGYEIPEAKLTWEELKSSIKVDFRTSPENCAGMGRQGTSFFQSHVALIQLCAKKYNIMEEDIRKVE